MISKMTSGQSIAAAVLRPLDPQKPKSSTAAPAGLSQQVSAEKAFVDVIGEARAALDAGYARLGKTADHATTGKQWDDVVGLKALDRRTLFAIASNSGGLFSEIEAGIADAEMKRRQSDVMMAADRTGQDPAKAFKAAIDYLDQGSAEEKRSLEWAKGRAAAETLYRWRMRDEGRPPENVGTGNLLVELFIKGYDELTASGDTNGDVRSMPSWLKALELWKTEFRDSDQFSWTL
jgi:hypothetical protein